MSAGLVMRINLLLSCYSKCNGPHPGQSTGRHGIHTLGAQPRAVPAHTYSVSLSPLALEVFSATECGGNPPDSCIDALSPIS